MKFGGFTSQLFFDVQQSISIEFRSLYGQNFRFFSKFLNLHTIFEFCHFESKLDSILTNNFFLKLVTSFGQISGEKMTKIAKFLKNQKLQTKPNILMV